MTKILIVDDHSEIRRLLEITFGEGFELLQAGNGKAGLSLAKQSRPEIVVLDVMMPGELDGLQVLDAIKADGNLTQTRVILLTARGQSSDCEEGIRRGADDYFVKPFSPLQLVRRINELI